MQSPWKRYNELNKSSPPRPRLLKTLSQFTHTSGLAMDIGAGSGRDSLELLRRGWQVTAVENDPASAAVLEDLVKDFPSAFKVLKVEMEDLSPQHGTFDLINASYSLPFCVSTEFEKMWEQIFAMLRPNGILSAEIFGDRDDWNKVKGGGLSFFTRAQADHLISPYEILHFEEVEQEKLTFSGTLKHWHYFSVIGRKPLPQSE